MDNRRILVIAGSDSSGGAGLEADQKTIAAHGCYAMTATTALTAQNTLGVSGIHHTPPDFVVKQIDACFDDIGVDVVKIGMLASAETVDAVAFALRRHNPSIVIVDPVYTPSIAHKKPSPPNSPSPPQVMVSTSGSQLLPRPAIRNLLTNLLPLTTLLTPNIPEALLLLETHTPQHPPSPPKSLPDLINLTKSLHALIQTPILLKGGHLPLPTASPNTTPQTDLSPQTATTPQTPATTKTITNILYTGTTPILLQTPYNPSKNTHGTGCTLASSIAANLAVALDSIIPRSIPPSSAPSSTLSIPPSSAASIHPSSASASASPAPAAAAETVPPPHVTETKMLAAIDAGCTYVNAAIKGNEGKKIGKGEGGGGVDHFVWGRFEPRVDGEGGEGGARVEPLGQEGGEEEGGVRVVVLKEGGE